MDIETELRRLETGYRVALSGCVAAKAAYLAQSDSVGATPASLARAHREWLRLDQRRRALARAMSELEAMEQAVL
jgi:hypothetical protein